jgi:hypothetical protein
MVMVYMVPGVRPVSSTLKASPVVFSGTVCIAGLIDTSNDEDTPAPLTADTTNSVSFLVGADMADGGFGSEGKQLVRSTSGYNYTLTTQLEHIPVLQFKRV